MLNNKVRQAGDYTVDFTIEKKTLRRGIAFMLYDNYGHSVGIFATEAQAKHAMPKIKDRIIREYKRRDNLSANKG